MKPAEVPPSRQRTILRFNSSCDGADLTSNLPNKVSNFIQNLAAVVAYFGNHYNISLTNRTLLHIFLNTFKGASET